MPRAMARVEPAPAPAVAEVVEGPTTTTPTRPPLRVKVTVTLNPFRIRCEPWPVPSAEQVRTAVPPRYRKLIPDRYWGNWTLSDLMVEYADSVPPQVWADAIGRTILRNALQVEGGTFDSDLLARDTLESLLTGGSYIALGGLLYKLHPTAAISTNKALAATRAQVRAQVESEATQLREAAQREASIIIRQAEEAQQRVEVLRTELAASAGLVLPSWVRGFTVDVCGAGMPYPFKIRLNGAPLTIKSFRYEHPDGRVFVWRLQRYYNTMLNLRVPINFASGAWHSRGTVAFGHTSTTREEPIKLPHISSEGTCLQPADVPPTITSLEDLLRVSDSFMRAHEVVNLNSLWRQPDVWPPALLELCPRCISGARWTTAAALGTATETTTRGEEAQHTWTQDE